MAQRASERSERIDRIDRAREVLVFTGRACRVGFFDARPWHADFATAGSPIGDHTTLAFPRTAVHIRHDGEGRFVVDPTIVTCYNPGQAFSRARLSAEGDQCLFLQFPAETAAEALAPFDRRAARHPARPFNCRHLASSPAAYFAQSGLSRYLAASGVPDPLLVEETCLRILDSLVASTFGRRRAELPEPGAAARRRRRRQVETVKEALARRYRERPSLSELAAEAGCSAPHLCRIFKRATGRTLHQHLEQLRLRAALEVVLDPGLDLTQAALELGFCDHSHFTAAFRRAFACVPSRYRELAHRETARRAALGVPRRSVRC